MNAKANVKTTRTDAVSDDIGFENIASSCRHQYAHYEDEMFRDSFDPEVLLRAADEIERLRNEITMKNNTLIYYSLKTLTALKDLHKQVGDTISWSHLNELYEMKGFITG